MKKQKHSLTTWGLMGAVGLAVASVTMPANADEMMHKGHRLLLKSAVENADFTEVTLPIFDGQRNGEIVWFVVTESSDKPMPSARGPLQPQDGQRQGHAGGAARRHEGRQGAVPRQRGLRA